MVSKYLSGIFIHDYIITNKSNIPEHTFTFGGNRPLFRPFREEDFFSICSHFLDRISLT